MTGGGNSLIQSYVKFLAVMFALILLCFYPFSLTGSEIPSWNVTVKNQSSTILLASWEAPPQSFLNGSPVKEYLILYKAAIYSVTFVLRVPSSQNDVHITALEQFTEYKVQIVAIGDKDNVRGRSAAHIVKTDEDGMCVREQLICKKS